MRKLSSLVKFSDGHLKVGSKLSKFPTLSSYEKSDIEITNLYNY